VQSPKNYQHFNEEQLLDALARGKEAVGLYTGKEFYIQFANESLIQLLGKGPEVIGESLLHAMPELNEHVFMHLLREAWRTGEPQQKDDLVFRSDATAQPFCFKVLFSPLHDADGNVYSVLHTMMATELRNSSAHVANNLTGSDQRFRQMIDLSPVAMLIFRGDEFIFEEVNPVMLELLGKDRSIKGRSLHAVMPELSGQPILDVLCDTYRTGRTNRLKEEKVFFMRNGRLYQGYYNVTYTPLWENGRITGLMESAEDVTEAVEARQRYQQTEERLRLAVEAADMGTFSVHTPSMAFEGSARFRELFGFTTRETLSYETCLNRIGDDFREAVASQIEQAIETGKRVEMEFTVHGIPDRPERWIRSAGTLQRDQKGQGEYFTGIVMEVSEQLVYAWANHS
jgi:PAS domain S-box-containing protein